MVQKTSNYPNRFGGGVAIAGLPVLNTYGGNVYWVDSGGVTTGDGTFKRPFTTIDLGIGACSASNGDIVMVKAGHAEAISTVDIDADVAGVSIVGLGIGTNMPTITFTLTTDTTKFDVSAANVSVSGLRFFFNDNDAVDSTLTINGVNAEIYGCDFIAGSSDQPDTFITVGIADADADGAYIHHNRFISASAGAVSAILLAKDHANVRIEDNHIDGAFSDAGISGPTAGDACTAISIQRNYVRNTSAGQFAIELVGTTSTGIIADNRLVTDAQATALDAGTCSCMGNLWNITTGGDSEGVPVNPTGDVATNFIGFDDADNAAATSSVVANRDGSVLERLEHIAQNQVDDVAGNMIGFDDGNNVAATTSVVADRDGSVLERLEAIYAAQVDDVAANMIGFDDANNVAATTSVVADEDGSVLERLEQIQEAVNKGSGTALGTNESLVDVLYGANGIVTWPTVGLAPANNVSMAEVLRAIYNAVSADSAADSVAVQPGLGRRVTKVGDVSTSTDALFNVTGKCLITLIVGEVTSVVATTTSLQLYTSTGSIALHASTDIISDAAGTLYLVTGDPDDLLNGSQTPNVDVAMSKTGVMAPMMMNDDAIWQSINGAGTGLIQWDLYYIPLEASASIASAA